MISSVHNEKIKITVSGGHLEGVGSCDGLKPHCSGLEARLMGEVGKAAARQGLTRETAKPILGELLKKYEHVFPVGNEGLHFDEVYGADGEPCDFWLKMYEEVWQDLEALGLKK